MEEEQRGCRFGLVELLVTVFVVGMSIAILLPGIGGSRQASPNAQCKSNLRQIGLALHNYQSAIGCYPPGVLYGSAVAGKLNEPKLDPREFYATGFELLLPYMEQQQIKNLGASGQPWYGQPAAYLSAIVPTLICPANQNPLNPTADPYYARLGVTVGVPLTGAFGRTDYIFCKGVTDAWCLTPANILDWKDMPVDDQTAIAPTERGMFDIAFPPEFELRGGTFIVTQWMILDGTSNTLAVGEGSAEYLAMRGTRTNRPTTDEHDIPRSSLIATESIQFWAVPPNTSAGVATGLYMASIFGCTLEPLNTLPVTHTVIELAPGDLCNCRASVDYDGPQGPARGAGVHRTSGFRSAHRGGANFVYADGSVQFVSEGISMPVYRALSTIAGGEAAANPQ